MLAIKNETEKSTPFLPEENEFLLECVSERIKIVENKSTNGSSVHQKKTCWLEIEKCFAENLNCSNRTAPQLKTKWDNLKQVSQHFLLLS